MQLRDFPFSHTSSLAMSGSLVPGSLVDPRSAIGLSNEVGGVSVPVRCLASTGEQAVRLAVRTGGPGPTGTAGRRRTGVRRMTCPGSGGPASRGAPRALPGESGDEREIILRHADGRMDMEPRVRPGAHALQPCCVCHVDAGRERAHYPSRGWRVSATKCGK